MDLAPGKLFGSYRLEAKLGGGGFGAVWRATDTKTDLVVALKILSGSLSEGEGAQLRTDVELLAAAASAGSEHVVKVLGGGLEPEPHVVMEFLDGADLAASLASRGPLPQAETIAIGEAVADALAALGHVGIIHRDVKPANIMLCADGTVKLTDFGIAKIVGFDTVTSTGQLPLTMAYAAPEQWIGTRAAELSYSVLEELKKKDVGLPDNQHPLLDDVGLISAVSGGSFTGNSASSPGEIGPVIPAGCCPGMKVLRRST